ncbi:MAG: patatin-like phospholipase family protein [Burkholderiales bacterium]
MLDLADIPFFSSVPTAALNSLRRRVEVRLHSAGTVLLRMGDPGTEVHMLAAGAVRADLEAAATGHSRRVILGPGQTLGEMAILSGLPISATVTAIKDSITYCLPGPAFIECLREQPILYRTISEMLIERLRHRTGVRADSLQPALAVLAVEVGAEHAERLSSAVVAGVCFYAPGSIYFDATRNDEELLRLPAFVAQWRDTGGGEQYLIVSIDQRNFERIRTVLVPGDVVLQIDSSTTHAPRFDAGDSGVADYQQVNIGPRAHSRDTAGVWAFAIDDAELDSWKSGPMEWTRSAYPALDQLVRYVVAREVGIAMSVGVAAGFAHFGVLDGLEEAGLPLDYVCGSSMGGVVALAYAKFGSARRAGEITSKFGAANSKIRDAAWLPRASVFAGEKGARAAREIFGDDTLAELMRPAAVVAADLVAGERVIIDSGSAAQAALATSAIPGLFPPVSVGSRIFVDGGVVTRVPVDLLLRRRCAYRIAIRIALQSPKSIAEREIEAARLRAAVAQPLGLRHVIGASWKLLGWWDSASQAQRADMVISVRPPSHEGFNFDSGYRMIELGKRCAETHADAIREVAARILAPGAP